MPATETKLCSRCSKEHQEFSQISFPYPAEVFELTDVERGSMVELNGDFCTINRAGVSERFIRCEFIQKIIGRCETVNYLVWVKLGEISYREYKEVYNKENTYGSYVGWLSNVLPYYKLWQNIPVTAYKRNGNQKPDIVPHRNVDHPLANEYYNGIKWEIVQERLTRKQKKDATGSTHREFTPWWKFWKFIFAVRSYNQA